MVIENPFLDEIAKDETIKENKKVAPSKVVSKNNAISPNAEKKGRGRPKSDPNGPDESKTYLYRTSPEYYAQLKMFCMLSGTTVNGLIDDALKLFLNNKSNADLFEIAKKHVNDRKS